MQSNISQTESFWSRWSKRFGLGPKSSLAVALLALASGIATYGSLTVGDNNYTKLLVIADLVFLVILAGLVSQRLMRMWRRNKTGKAGSAMHRRVVRLFILIAVAPALMVALFSALFFNIYFQKHFSDPVNEAVAESLGVADAYIKENIQNIRIDALGIAADINRVPVQILQSKTLFSRFLTEQVAARNLSEAVVLDGNKRIIAQSNLSFLVEFDQMPNELIEKATSTQVIIATEEGDERVRALVQLDRILDGYLFISRYIDPRVLGHLERTRKASEDYRQLKEEGFGIQIQFAVIFIIISLMVVLAAVWFGLAISSRLVGPIAGLVDAAERVRDGDLKAKVDERVAYDEMAILSRSFNSMVGELSSQQERLRETNQQLDERRRFTETVLSGVSSGVIGLNKEGVITLPNRTASDLLSLDVDDMVGQSLYDVAPEFKDLLNEVRERPSRISQGQIHLESGDKHRQLLVRIAAEISASGVEGFVVTIEEITELVSAQRMAAWGDIARRIAHEIKNPLTPIQLAAERIRRKYGKEITSDREVFDKCTDTIIRQVGDIGQMVDEFSAFARMPAPVFKAEPLARILEEAVFLQKVGHPEIVYTLNELPSYTTCKIDEPQVKRVFTNLMQNAADAIEGREGDSKDLPEGSIEITVIEEDTDIIVRFEDNGRGLPSEDRNRLTEPYVTHREKGTGLGLAIVNKIMEEHGGSLILRDASNPPGACVEVFFKKTDIDDETGK
ncbi:PAS domain-containing protein [Sneathiella sp. P13V-1]|uniref:sensor histidine kinase NtrY-like n=1 Tax=Sneathiella sp. P13V-1 TaxID=2697366 RepID=UPI00187B5C4D|nr:PAS domain-containing sensor histidine kinase [Sneathiella sp. P13V-1]MBE7637325.1 PAS domain-containing protein [Sneathiella sp. P13V-1]